MMRIAPEIPRQAAREIDEAAAPTDVVPLHIEAAANRDLPLDGMVKLVVEDWIKTLFRRLDAIAGQLLPTAYGREVTPVDTTPRLDAPRISRGAKINRQNL